MAGEEPKNNVRSETTVEFLNRQLAFLEAKIKEISEIDPLNKLLLDYTRAATTTKILIDKAETAIRDGQPEAKREERHQLLKTFGVGLLNSVMPFIPDDQRQAAVLAASDYGESYPH